MSNIRTKITTGLRRGWNAVVHTRRAWTSLGGLLLAVVILVSANSFYETITRHSEVIQECFLPLVDLTSQIDTARAMQCDAAAALPPLVDEAIYTSEKWKAVVERFRRRTDVVGELLIEAVHLDHLFTERWADYLSLNESITRLQEQEDLYSVDVATLVRLAEEGRTGEIPDVAVGVEERGGELQKQAETLRHDVQKKIARIQDEMASLRTAMLCTMFGLAGVLGLGTVLMTAAESQHSAELKDQPHPTDRPRQVSGTRTGNYPPRGLVLTTEDGPAN